MISGFFDNTTVESEDFATFVRGILTNGVTGDTTDVLKVTAAGGMNVSIAEGYAWINGRFGKVETPETLAINTASGSLSRIDRVVVRLDMSAATVKLAVLTGTAAVSPSAPELTRDGTVHELCLAEIVIGAGVTSITDSNITDTRADRTLCGAVLANTKESLSLEGKADQSDLEALEASVAVDITKLYARTLASKDLISESVSGTSSVTLSQSMTGYGVIKLKGNLTMRLVNTSDSSIEDESADFEMVLLGIGDTTPLNITIRAAIDSSGTIGGGSEAWKAKITPEITSTGLTLTAEVLTPETTTTERYGILAISIEYARAVYMT